ncbi:hypothetical protein MFFC18_35670 [Mariniblastus fucicola]|uniref:Outer membrane efflux protein n=2 Tax=Mariniblastus fucicola TaxID=980251 RepID=A0A5B9PGD8_9BACT|nr:hypothetical protein MFFC18_35670 [Mariniblastus fucicola]
MIGMALVTLSAIFAPPVGAFQTEEMLEKERRDTSRFFEQAHESLSEALDMFDEKGELKESKDIAFYDFLSRSQEAQQTRIEGYLDAASDALGISSISDQRQIVAGLRQKISAAQRELTIYERKKISAPESTYNPLAVTREGYEEKIAAKKEQIVEFESQIADEKQKLVEQLEGIGLKLDAEQIDILLESITGDEFIRVSIIFDNAKNFALELEELTEKTGEDLDAAKRYYGVYLMLLKTVDRLQNKFIDNVDDEYYPKLDAFAQKAMINIEEAERAIKAGGDAEILNNNIASNQVTYDAVMLYKQGLAHQKHQMMNANLECRRNILTAVNTYRTVALSKDVASLMATSRRAFDAITNLTVPDLKPFENLKVKEAFLEITRDLRK